MARRDRLTKAEPRSVPGKDSGEDRAADRCGETAATDLGPQEDQEDAGDAARNSEASRSQHRGRSVEAKRAGDSAATTPRRLPSGARGTDCGDTQHEVWAVDYKGWFALGDGADAIR